MSKKVLVPIDHGGQRAVNLAPGVDPTDAAIVAQLDDVGGGTQNVFVQASAPSNPPATYLWVQTELGDGADMTFWVEDGT